jgi:hypothetical protein
MADPGSPDQSPKPFKPGPKKGWYSPRSAPPRKLNEGDDTHTDQAPKKELDPFQIAAIKCAQMEEKLANLLRARLEENLNDDGDEYDEEQEIEDGVYLRKNFDLIDIASEKEDIIPNFSSTHPNTRIVFEINRSPEQALDDSYVGENRQPSLKNYTLTIYGLFADRAHLATYDDYVSKGGTSKFTRSEFQFSPLGEFTETVFVPTKFFNEVVKDPAIPLVPPDWGYCPYEPKPDVNNFEIAGQALQMLINRLKPQEKPAE